MDFNGYLHKCSLRNAERDDVGEQLSGRDCVNIIYIYKKESEVMVDETKER